MKAVNIGLVGLGTIGCGTVDILQRNRSVLKDRLGASIDIVRASDIDLKRPRPVELPARILTPDAWEVIRDPEVQIMVELIGGIEPARSLILEAFDRGKHVVTANKALLSTHWSELVSKADDRGVTLGFEGSVAGGIPLIRAIKVGLVANRIRSVTGIINGTCNYILTRMHREGRPFPEILGEAQAMGYAEADPALDVEGVDAAQKLAVLVNLCFNSPVSHADILHRGITEITPLDLEMAEEFGFRVKLLASATQVEDEVEAWVYPALVPEGHPLATVDGVFNAVYIEDDNLGPSLYYGRGAGDLPTGSAVVADIVSCARDILSGAVARLPVGGQRHGLGSQKRVSLSDDTRSEFYVRMSAADRPGVLSTIAGILGRNEISIASVIQRGRESAQGEGVPIVMITHEASYSRMMTAIGEIDDQEVVVGNSFSMRILRSD
ncbi:MAG: homoserine dehydrogenase [bacterium]|nr:MAG: homoserine dehydrogenase [bacterium]